MRSWIEVLYPFTIDAENELIEQAQQEIESQTEGTYLKDHPTIIFPDNEHIFGDEQSEEDIEHNNGEDPLASGILRHPLCKTNNTSLERGKQKD